jgi:hypothetical protein
MMGIPELIPENSIITLPGTKIYRRAADGLWVTSALGQSGVREVLLGSDGATPTENPTLRPNNRKRGFGFGGGDQINYGDDADFSFPAVPFSLAVLVKLTTLSGNHALIAKENGIASGEYGLLVEADGTIGFRLIDDDNAAMEGRESAAGAVKAGLTTILVATADGVDAQTGSTIYQDQVQVDTANISSGAGYVQMRDTNQDLLLGDGGSLAGAIGDIVLPMIFDWELSLIEVIALTEQLRRWANIS